MPLFRNHLLTTTFLASFALVCTPSHADDTPASLLDLDTTTGHASISVYGMSADGRTVVGFDSDLAFKWSSDGGYVDLGNLGESWQFAEDASGDGTIVVGGGTDASWRDRSFRWTAETGMVDLGEIAGSSEYSVARAISDDGTVIAGTYWTSGWDKRVYIWTEATGMVGITGLTSNGDSSPDDISGDGTTIVGWSESDTEAGTRAFYWTEATGMIDIGSLGGTTSYASAVSYDGSAIAGRSKVAGNTHYRAFYWTEAEGMVNLGTLGGTASEANAISGDGSIVVGKAQIDGDTAYHAFRWTAESGMQDLNTLLSDAGVDMTGITLASADTISSGGAYIVATTASGMGGSTAYLVQYGTESSGLTTAADQQVSTNNLSQNQQTAQVQGRSVAGELMGFARPMASSSFAYGGGMFGSAAGYFGAQYSARGITLLGGFGFGSQDYPNVHQHGSATVALAGRYTFDNVLGTKVSALKPYLEIGSWIIPKATLTLRRPYANGGGTAVGQGTTDTTSWAGYVRAGVIFDWNALNQFVVYSDIGQQYMRYDGYIEETDASNPFPATVDDGVYRMTIVRAGGSWTRKLDDLLGDWSPVPVAVTVAGAAAHSFGVHSDLTMTVAGIGTLRPADREKTWAEFGARVETTLPNRITVGLELNGTAGGQSVGTAIHGGANLGYKF